MLISVTIFTEFASLFRHKAAHNMYTVEMDKIEEKLKN